jgi:transaldolase
MIREIIRPEKEQLIIDIPKAYVNKEVEILVFPLQGIEKKKSIEPDANQALEEFRHLMAQLEESNINIKIPEDLDIDDMIDEINSDIY